jgi:osmotically-inducible protein OsmY
VSERVVTLTGNVRNRNSKIAAWDCAWMTPGVEDVFNNVVVKRRRGAPDAQ